MGSMISGLIEQTSLIVLDFLYKQTIFTAVLFVIIFAVSLLMRKKSQKWYLGLWLLIPVRLLLPADLYFQAGIRNLFEQVLNINKLTATVDAISKNININQYNISELVLTNSPQNQTDAFIPWYVLLTFIWSIGGLLMFIVLIKKHLKSYHIIKKSSFVHDSIFANMLTDLNHQLKIRRTIGLISSEDFLSPFSVGILKPQIYIPQSLLKSGDMDTIKSVIAHEMIHIKQYDALWIKLQNILQIIYFFNPVVWYANRQINIAREQICDSSVLNRGIISPEVYGNSLIKVLKANYIGFDLMHLLPCFGSHKKIFKQRIQNISKGKAMKTPRTFLIVLVIFLIGAVVLPLAGTSCVKNVSEKAVVAKVALHFKLVDDAYTTKVMNWIAENNKKLPDDIDDQHQLLLQISKYINLPEDLELLFHFNRDHKTDKLYPQDIMTVERAISLGQNDISEAQLYYNEDNEPYVSVQMNSGGTMKLKRVTGENRGRRLAIIIDNKIRSAPTINAQIVGGKGAITGNYTMDEAKDLVDILNKS